jgi:heme/copper-type cytochrome/quinol oxidase subunit 2
LIPARTLVIIVIAASVALGGGVITYAVGIGLPTTPQVPSCNGVAGGTLNFTIIAGENGYNDSVDHQGQSWPVMNVRRCDLVRINVVNTDEQPHGFAVDYYEAKGAEISGGQTYLVQFLAAKPGQFHVYCSIFCTVHYAMLSGLLNVS